LVDEALPCRRFLKLYSETDNDIILTGDELMNVTVLGCGRWASFQAWYADKIGMPAMIWGLAESEITKALIATRRNDYLELPADVEITDDLEKAINFADVIIIAIESQQLRVLCRDLVRIKGCLHKPVLLCMKGLEKDSGLRLTQVARQEMGDSVPLAVWVGPGHPQDFVRGVPSCMIIDSDNSGLARKLAEDFTSPLIRLYYGNDLIGAEVGAATKNIIGIAAGMLDGLDYSPLKGALMARGAREISRLVVAMGGQEITVYGLCHLGDYEATLFSPHSHNRAFGLSLISGKPYDKLAEGVHSTDSVMRLSEKYSLELPICAGVSTMLSSKAEAKDMLIKLFTRDIKNEFLRL